MKSRDGKTSSGSPESAPEVDTILTNSTDKIARAARRIGGGGLCGTAGSGVARLKRKQRTA
jgi:hypothetical protein